MKIRFSDGLLNKLDTFSLPVQKKFHKRIRFLLSDIRHPSLHAKRYKGTSNIWQARVDRSFRFYFVITGDTYIVLDIREHD